MWGFGPVQGLGCRVSLRDAWSIAAGVVKQQLTQTRQTCQKCHQASQRSSKCARIFVYTAICANGQVRLHSATHFLYEALYKPYRRHIPVLAGFRTRTKTVPPVYWRDPGTWPKKSPFHALAGNRVFRGQDAVNVFAIYSDQVLQ